VPAGVRPRLRTPPRYLPPTLSTLHCSLSRRRARRIPHNSQFFPVLRKAPPPYPAEQPSRSRYLAALFPRYSKDVSEPPFCGVSIKPFAFPPLTPFPFFVSNYPLSPFFPTRLHASAGFFFPGSSDDVSPFTRTVDLWAWGFFFCLLPHVTSFDQPVRPASPARPRWPFSAPSHT